MFNLCGRTVQSRRLDCSVFAVRLFNSKRSGCSTWAEYSPGLAALVASCLRQFLSLRLQQLVESLLYATSNQFLDLPLDNFLVELYNVVGHGLPSPFECLCSNFILPETGKPCLLFCFLQFAQFIIHYRHIAEACFGIRKRMGFTKNSCTASPFANTAPSEPVARRKRATHAGEVSHRKRTSEPLPNNAR